MNYLKCFFINNLGDDMLINSLCNRYPKEKFILCTYDKSINMIDNTSNNLYVKRYNEIVYRAVRKTSVKIFKCLNLIEANLINKCDRVIILGGSLFMEPKDSKITKSRYSFSDIYEHINKSYYILGSNIGPVYTENYIEEIKENVFLKAQDVCLRDENSYKYVSDLKNVRVATDIIFSYDVSKYRNIIEKNKVIISVIDIERKKGQIVNPNLEEYENIILKIIEFYIGKNYEVELMSFCKPEGDEIAIDRIIKKSNKKENIKKYYYRGNIDEALKEIASAKIIVGTRFHANVIGLLLNKVVIPIIYNDKTRNLLEDIHFDGEIIDIDKLDSFDINKLDSDRTENYRCDISGFIEKAEIQYKELDKVLKK